MYLLWLRVAAVLYGLASVTALPAVLGDRPRWQRICLPVTIAGWIFHFVAFVEMLVAAHRLMPVGMHQVQSTLSLLIVTAFLLIWGRYRTISFGVFAGATKPCQVVASKPLRPSSSTVGISGRSAVRLSVVTASGRTWPLWMCATTDAAVANIICT